MIATVSTGNPWSERWSTVCSASWYVLYGATGLRCCSVIAQSFLPARTEGFEHSPGWRAEWLHACAWRVRNARVRSPHEHERDHPNISEKPTRERVRETPLTSL
ncbi:protein of unknown function [Streptomyces murinus]